MRYTLAYLQHEQVFKFIYIMEINTFIEHFAAQFSDTPVESFNETTNFKELEDWDSLIALSLIAMADEEYQVKLTGDDIRSSKTVSDIYEKIKSKKA